MGFPLHAVLPLSDRRESTVDSPFMRYTAKPLAENRFEIWRDVPRAERVFQLNDSAVGTVENQRSKELWSDAYQQYPVIQGFSIEQMLADERPNLPPTWGFKHGGRTSAPQLL